MKISTRALAVILVAILAIGVVVMLGLRGYRSKTVLDYGRMPDKDISLLFTDTTMVGRKDGKKLWEIHADKIRISRDQIVTRLEKISDGVVYHDDKPLFRLTAGRASYDATYGSLSIEGGVKLSSRDGVTLSCSSASWDGLKNRVKCPGKVEIALRNGKLVGQDLEGDGNLKEVELHRIHLSVRLQGEQESLLP